MYATFVAPVQQYSTETEPSRQPSFNYASRQPSFKQQNSSENENNASCPQPPTSIQDHLASSSCPPAAVPSSEEIVQDSIYDGGKVPKELEEQQQSWAKNGGGLDLQEEVKILSEAELEDQLDEERNTFMSGGSSNNEEEEDEEYRMFLLPTRGNPHPHHHHRGPINNPNNPVPPPSFAQEASLGQWGSGEESGETKNTLGYMIFGCSIVKLKRKSLKSEGANLPITVTWVCPVS